MWFSSLGPFPRTSIFESAACMVVWSTLFVVSCLSSMLLLLNLTRSAKLSALEDLKKPTVKTTVSLDISLTACLYSSGEEWIM